MKQNKFNLKIRILNSIIILLSIIGLIVCISILFPQVRQIIVDLAGRILHKEIIERKGWLNAFLSYAIGGICVILFFDYCTLTNSGRSLVYKAKQEIKDCLSEIDFRSLLKPVLLLFGVYLLGILTIIRANFLYMDDVSRSVEGGRMFYPFSRYVIEFASIFVHGDTNLTDISPLPQMLAILILSISSVLLVYILCNKKITTVGLLASIPLGLSPYFLECLSFKFDAPYMALSILASIVPFIFIARKKAFIFCSVVSLLIMCMTYQAASGIYPMIAVILCFKDWNGRKKPDKEILSFLSIAAFTFCFAMSFYKFFLMKPVYDGYAVNTMHPLSNMIPGILLNIKNYAKTINSDFGIIWKTGIAIICILFVTKSICTSLRKKTLSFLASVLVISVSFILSYGLYSMLSFFPDFLRTLYGFGVFLAILCIYVVSDYKKVATISVLALNYCFLIFALSYGNAMADQARYAEFRIGILLHDLSNLYPDQDGEEIKFQIKNSIDYAPSIKNISKHYPVIERLVDKRLGEIIWVNPWDNEYIWRHFNYNKRKKDYLYDFDSLNLPIVLDSYYHTIKGNENHCLVILKH